MTKRNALIGQVKKLDGRPVVVIGVGGNDLQVDHWSDVPWTPLVHVDRLLEMLPYHWTDKDLSKLRIQAVEHLGVWNGARALALGTLSLLHSFEHREKVVRNNLCEEDQTTDEMTQELENTRAKMCGLVEQTQRTISTLTMLHNQSLDELERVRRERDELRRRIEEMECPIP